MSDQDRPDLSENPLGGSSGAAERRPGWGSRAEEHTLATRGGDPVDAAAPRFLHVRPDTAVDPLAVDFAAHKAAHPDIPEVDTEQDSTAAPAPAAPSTGAEDLLGALLDDALVAEGEEAAPTHEAGPDSNPTDPQAGLVTDVDADHTAPPTQPHTSAAPAETLIDAFTADEDAEDDTGDRHSVETDASDEASDDSSDDSSDDVEDFEAFNNLFADPLEDHTPEADSDESQAQVSEADADADRSEDAEDPDGGQETAGAEEAAPAGDLEDLFAADGEDLAPVRLSDLTTSDAAPEHSHPADHAPVPVTEPGDHAAPATYQPQPQTPALYAQLPGHDAPSTYETVQAIAADPDVYRYANAARLDNLVHQITSLGVGADPATQGMLRSFKLTNDRDQDAAQRAKYEQVMLGLMQGRHIPLSNAQEAQAVFDIAYDQLIGIGPLGPLWRDDDITEIMVSGPDKVTVERNGRLLNTPAKFKDRPHLERVARELAALVDDRAVSRSNPLVGAQLPGARLQVVMDPVAPLVGVSMTIRKFRPLFGINDLLNFGALDDTMLAFLADAVAARANILVSGSTGAGKTTMINALSAFIPDTERVITIEDALELSLTNTHIEQLLTKEAASGDDTVIIGQDALLRATLRMRPDRIIVGEIRDGKGCATMLQAANTGHDGTMTTVHAPNSDRALRRLAQLLRSTSMMGDDVAREEVLMAFDLVVQVVRVRGRRFISEICAVNPDPYAATGAVPLFRGEFPPTADKPVFRQVGALAADTELAARMSDAGRDPDVWQVTR